jgi:transposase
MQHYAGLDISVKETSICIVDETGQVRHEVKVASYPEDLVRVLRDPAWNLERIGLEAGPLSQWLFSGLVAAELPAVCIETRHARAFLQARINKNDRNDARGIAQMMRVNLFRPVHVKTLASQRQRALLTARKLLQGKAFAIENDVRGLMRNFGLKVGPVGAIKFEARIRELVAGLPDLAEITEALLAARRQLREQFTKLHKKLLALVRDDGVCRRPDDHSRRRTGDGAGVPGHNRHSRALCQLQGGRRHPRADTDPASVGREQPDRQGLAVRRRHIAQPALRRRAEHACLRHKMVLVEGVGRADRQTTRHQKGHRCPGAPARGGHAPHVGRRHRVPVDQRRG